MTLGDFVTLQGGHDLTEPERRVGRDPVMGSAGQNGFHNKALAKGPGIRKSDSSNETSCLSWCTFSAYGYKLVERGTTGAR